MPKEIKIQAKTIDAAVGVIIGILEDTSKGNTISVSGWHGFGASATLKAVAQRLKSSESKFDRVVHVDCSLWKRMRALQKAVAEELELQPLLMAIFDRQDEEDNFSGIDEGSRGVIADIKTEIFRKLASSRFVVIFHNGSNDYIDLCECCGVPVIPILNNKVLWTWHGRFQTKHIYWRQYTDVVINYFHDCIREEALLEEAKEVATYMGIPEPYMNHMIVEKCFQYAYALGSVLEDINWRRHTSNYLVCDEIIQGQGDTSAWGVADALQRNMCMDWILKWSDDDVRRHLQCRLPDRLVFVKVLSEATSFFVVADCEHYQMMTLPDGIFQHSHSSMHVLHLSWCSFSFESPTFLCCSQLRFLQLDTCTDLLMYYFVRF